MSPPVTRHMKNPLVTLLTSARVRPLEELGVTNESWNRCWNVLEDDSMLDTTIDIPGEDCVNVDTPAPVGVEM